MGQNDFSFKCLKDGFYDSGLLTSHGGEKILNLNDCEVNTKRRALEVYSLTGAVDLLLTQFSFAAWKGGKENKRWRKDAAQQKLEPMKLQLEVFNPKIVSMQVYLFLNKTNSYQ